MNEIKPYFVVDAIGGEAIIPNIKGIDRDNVYMAEQVLNGSTGAYFKG